jgi:L,D-peptidoglycan transpeptidase YkuD (ErfK/YbiS/YcfS/YnhG family)
VIRSIVSVLVLLLAAAAQGRTPDNRMPLGNAQQLVLVTTADWSATEGLLRRYERAGGSWRAVGGLMSVTVGRNGSAWGTGLGEIAGEPRKREGDGKAPAGAFAIGSAFGYAKGVATSLPYRAMRESDWCIDVPASPLYNTIVDANEVGAAAIDGSTEPMRRDIHAGGDQRYALGFVIEHNPARTPGGGSCIFAHVWKAPGEATAGCTAMAQASMRELLAWLRPESKPVFVLLPEAEVARLRETWGLP